MAYPENVLELRLDAAQASQRQDLGDRFVVSHGWSLGAGGEPRLQGILIRITKDGAGEGGKIAAAEKFEGARDGAAPGPFKFIA